MTIKKQKRTHTLTISSSHLSTVQTSTKNGFLTLETNLSKSSDNNNQAKQQKNNK